jgi:hypothetical protein
MKASFAMLLKKHGEKMSTSWRSTMFMITSSLPSACHDITEKNDTYMSVEEELAGCDIVPVALCRLL